MSATRDTAPDWYVLESGDAVLIASPDPTGLTPNRVVTLLSAEVEQIFTTMRARQLGADTKGDL
jgi:hypothetical protein